MYLVGDGLLCTTSKEELYIAKTVWTLHVDCKSWLLLTTSLNRPFKHTMQAAQAAAAQRRKELRGPQGFDAFTKGVEDILLVPVPKHRKDVCRRQLQNTANNVLRTGNNAVQSVQHGVQSFTGAISNAIGGNQGPGRSSAGFR